MQALDSAATEDKYFLFIWHPHVMGIDADRLKVGERILKHVTSHNDFEIVTLEQLINASRSN